MSKNPGTVMDNWTGGCNSLLPPDCLPQGQYSWLINGVNRGGIVQTRPGQDCIASVQGTKIQGGTIFTPKDSRPMMLLAVDGLIYGAKFPFVTFVKIEGLQFSAAASIVNFQTTLKSVKLNADGSITLIDPVPLVIIQDGVTKAGSFDGTIGKHLDIGTPFFGPPIGLWMEWIASCLWIFDGSRGYVSDLANPDTFSATTYLAERSNFELPGEVTGCIKTTDEKSLLVFTSTTTTAFQANIIDRTLWGTTPQFQKLMLPSIGCVSGRSPVNQYGLTWWMSRSGFINLDAALYTQRSSKLTTVDNEMMRSKRIMSPDQSGICSTYYENYLLVSVPAGGKYNEQTWVADQAPAGQATGAQGAGMAWAGIWTGTRPVVWMKTEFAGRDRLFFVSYDATPKDATHIHVWEAFQDDRRDNDGRIACQMESAMVIGSELQRFRYAELDLCEILGPVELKIFVGGKNGPWYQVRDTDLRAEIGSIGSAVQKIIKKDTLLYSFKPQNRVVKTEQFSSMGRGCAGVESSNVPGLDKGFQILVEWRGRMGVKAIKIVTDEEASADSGECKEGEAGKINILTDRGETITA